MEANTISMLHNSILFAISCAFDLVIFCVVLFLFYKIYKTKSLVASNANRVHNHDDELFRLQEKIAQITNE